MLITKNDVIVELLCNIENALAQAKEAEEKLRELLEKAQLSQEGTTSDAISRQEELLDDGTLVVWTNTDMSKFSRVNVRQIGTHYGDLFYPDED